MYKDKEFEMELLKRLVKEYARATKRRKTEILSEYVELTGLNRATAQKRFRRYLFRDTVSNTNTQRGRKKTYRNSHREIIKLCWEYLLCPCAERLHPVLSDAIEQLLQEGLLNPYTQATIQQTKAVSLGTLKRIIGEFEKPPFKKNHRGNSFIHTQVPIEADFGSNAYREPGYVEVDFIEHNGSTAEGRFAITAVYTDLSSQWTVRASGFGKNLESVKQVDEIAHRRIPFRVVHYHPDNDRSILRVLFERVRQTSGVRLSRSRPYKKNDNAHVEQKGGDKVRKLVGYFRYDTQEEVSLLNEIYEVADTLENFFVPTMKLKCKIRDEKGRVVKKIYEQAKTPYQRLIERPEVPAEVKEQLKKTYKDLSLVELKQNLDELLVKLLSKKLVHKQKRFHGQKYDLTRIPFHGHSILI